MSLAAKLPYDHPYAGGFPGIGSQPLPTDSDCLTYLAAVAAADGAGVEVGVATAVDTFIKALKATPGLFDAIKASCILCGARTITGALVPLAGAAPSAEGAWSSGDYSRTAGMTGDGVALYIDTNVANDSDFSGAVADPQNDNHNAAFITGIVGGTPVMASRTSASQNYNYIDFFGGTRLASRSNNSTVAVAPVANTLQGHSRDNSTAFRYRCSGVSGAVVATSTTPDNYNVLVLGRNSDPIVMSEHTVAFYSIGTDIGSAGLAALDTAVNNLISDIGNAL